ncbi:Transcriptional-regulating factor 1 [Lucilia cuprina]|nr:Transcriptional-regulating factor 1 [Lucilia cuprina]
MATINSVPKSIHLPLTTSLSSAPRVLMCSASVGTEASVTLQLRDVNSNDSIQSNQSSSEAAAAAATIITSTSTNNHYTGGTGTTATSGTTTTTTTLDNALTIGYPDPEMLADVLGTLQTASLKNTNNPSGESTKQNSSKLTNTSDITNNNLNGTIKNRITISKRSTNIINNPQNTSSNNNNIINNNSSTNNNNNNNFIRDISKTTTTSAVQTVTTSTNTTTAVNKTNSYIKNCLIRSSSCSNTTNITSLAQIMSNSSNSSSNNTNSNNNGHSNCNNNSSNQINNSTTISCNGISNNNNSNNNLNQLNNNNTTTNNNSSNNSCNSNFSSSSNDSCFSYSSNSSSGNSVARSITSLSHGSRKVPGTLTTNPPKILKKSRSKISSPSRHGPQQCQICNKIFGNASALAKHKLTHSDERKYVCVMCSKAFKRQDHLNGHMMTHRNKKPYECKAEGCGKSYCDARSLRRHTENHHAGVIAPHNHQLLISNNNSNSNLSLSPATANGDASSPDGATCLGTYLSNGGTVVDAATGLALTEEELKALNVPLKTGVTLLSPTSTTSSMSSSSSMSNGPGATITLTDNSGNLDGEGLTREQLDLISKIMRQTKQTTAQVTVSSPTSSQSYKIDTNPPATAQTQNSRPRTWNMQLLNSSQNVAITVDEVNADNVNDSSANAQTKIKEDEIEIDLSNAINSNLFNLVKIDQKPVECNLCHRKFKNVPALNGHMRLHGGYFKKDPETKKSEKKENSGPPLQTASIGVRALIEEKIISKRSKDLNKGAFVVPAPPTSSNQSNTTTIRRSISDLDSFLNPKTQPNSTTTTNQQQNSTQQLQPQQQQQLPAVTTIKNNPKSNINVQDINLPQSIEIYSTKQQQQQTQQQQHHHQQQQKTMNNIGVGTTATTLNAERSATKITTTTAATINTTTTRSTSTDPKDSTLIELLKRGTRIAVTQKQPNNNTPLGGVTRQIITNKNNCSVIIPSEVQVVSTKGKLKKDDHIQMSNATNVTLPDGTPLSLTIAQGADSNSEVYTVTYTSDGSALFGENEVYNVSEAEMLLQTVDTMQLLNDAGDNLKPEHSEQFEVLDSKIEQQNCVDPQQQQQQLHQQQQLQQNSNQCQTTQTLPNFQHFHSKELIIQNPTMINHQQIRTNTLSLPQDMKNQFASSLNSPIHSPLAYPTPPSSHENVTQTSPYIEDNHHFNDAPNIFFSESLISSNNAGESENDKIMKLKSVLEDNSFDSNIKVEDLLNGTDPDTECDLREFAEANLSFLDEDQEFLNDSRNATSPLSESFFTSGIGTAEEVKEVLREVLTEDQLNLNCENQGENIIDLYYLPGLSLQSQMMPNSEDPLLSSSPRDFGQQQKLQNPMPQQQQQNQPQTQQQQQLPQIQHIPHQQPQQQIIQYNNQQQLTHPAQTVKISLDTNAQTSSGSTNSNSEINQLILNIPSNVIQNSCNTNSANSSSSSSSSSTTTLHYNVQNLPQVQNQSNIQQHPQLIMQQQQQQHQTQYLTSTTINSLNEALMQPIIYTSGTTDKMELKLDNNTNTTNPQLQNITSLNKPLEIVKNSASSSHIIFPQQTHSSTSTVSTSLQPLSNQTNSILKRRLKGHSSLESTSTHPSYSKYQALSPYKSKLRKPSRTHYTPAPILNPERKGHGLYCNVLKQLGCSLLSFDNFDDDFDDPVGLVDFSDESKVNLGSAYQASIPAFNENVCSTSAIEETVGCDLMWNPDVQRDDKILMRFIDLSKSSAVPLGSHSEEVALEALLKAQGNTATAVLSLLQTQSNSFQIKWSSQELEIFLKGLEKHGKEFSKISKELGTKTTGECVQMYYFWKKLCVDYKVTHLKTETPPQTHANDPKPYVCEIPDCSASFSSKAALHGHTRIHTYGRNSHHNNQHSNSNNTNATATTTNTNANSSQGSATNSNNHPMHNNSQSSHANTANPNQKDSNANKDNTEFPCKVCGKVFNKIKSRSAHMKTHRATDNETTVQITNNQNQIIQQQQQQQQQQQTQQL